VGADRQGARRRGQVDVDGHVTTTGAARS
jgi:hypothetical protein